MKGELPQKLDDKEIVKRYIKSIDKGLLKVMSKMGISTYQSYCGAQIFDAVGLQVGVRRHLFHRHGHPHRGRRRSTRSPKRRCAATATPFGDAPIYRTMLDVGGDYAFRVRGEDHVWNAATVATLQHAVRGNSYEHYRQYAAHHQRAVRTALHHPRPVPASRSRDGRRPRSRCRSRRSSRPQKSSSASPPAPCRSARSRARRTPRSPSP